MLPLERCILAYNQTESDRLTVIMAVAAEDRLLTKLLGVTLQYQTNTQDRALFLADLAQVYYEARSHHQSRDQLFERL